MRRVVAVVAAALVLAGTDSAAIKNKEAKTLDDGSEAARYGLHCDHSADDAATLDALVRTGGALAGKTLHLPSGCVILLGAGNGSPAVSIASNTTISCQDGTAGFALARRSCSSGSDTPGAACMMDAQCHDGTCVSDPGGPFAPSAGSTYVVFTGETRARSIQFENCSVWTHGGSGDSPAMGGSGKRWGYCDGGGSSTAGEGCYNACDGASGVHEGFACLANTDCNAGKASTPGSCTARGGLCKSLGGACRAIPYATHDAPSGPGTINVFDFSSNANVTIDSVTVYDHRRGDFTFSAARGSRILRSTNFASSLNANQASGQILGPMLYDSAASRPLTCGSTSPSTSASSGADYCLASTVSEGIVVNGADVVESAGYGWKDGIHAKNTSHVTASVGGGLGDPRQSGWTGNTDLLIGGGGVVATGFIGSGGLYCARPDIGTPFDGYNFIVANSFCDGQWGPKFIINGSGNQYVGDRLAWHGRGAVIGLSDQRGYCAGGPRSGQVCVFGAGDDAWIGCPTGATCAASNDFPASGANHAIVAGGTLLHSEQGASVSYVRAPDSKRCVNASARNHGGPCTSDGDCSTGSCDYLTWVNVLIDGSLFYAGAGATAFNLGTSSVGVSKTNDSPSISNWTVSGVDLNNFATGFAFPALCSGAACRYCAKGSNDGTSCTADTTCTGGGTCIPAVQHFVASGNVSTTTTPLSNWDAAYGDVSGLEGLTPADDQGVTITLTAGEALTRGQLVSASSSADNTVIKTTTANPERAIGVVTATTLSGNRAKVMTSGVANCLAQGSISRGNLLEPSRSTAGSVASGGSTDLVVGSALAGASDGQTFRCSINALPHVQNLPAFPKLTATNHSSTASVSSCGTYTQITTVSPSTTTGHTIEAIAKVPMRATTKRNVSIKIGRGGTGCGDATFLPSETPAVFTQVVSGGGDSAVGSAAVTESSLSTGSVTYRLCVCADDASGLTISTGSYLRVAEY